MDSGGKRKQEAQRNSQEHRAVLREQREKIRSGQKGNNWFEGEDEAVVLH